MAEFTGNLLVRLINHRVSDDRSRREDYLTECFAWLLENDPGLQEALLGVEGPFGQAGLRAGVPPGGGSRLSVVTQEPLPSRGRPDMRLSRGSSVLFIECKVDAPYDPNQISSYLGHACGLPAGFVAAIVPATSAPAAHDLPSDERFLGVFSWQQIDRIVAALPESRDARDEFRCWFRNLLSSMNLAPVDGPFEWEAEQAVQDRDTVQTIITVLDEAVARLRLDSDLQAAAIDLYRPDGRKLRIDSARAISGGGKPPRPFLQHCATLRSRYSPMLAFSVQTFFLRPSYLRRWKEPMVVVACEPRGWAGEYCMPELDLLLQHLFPESSARQPPDKAAKTILLNRFISRLSSLLERLRKSLPSDVPTTVEYGVQRYCSLYLPLFPTSVLCPKRASPVEVGARFETWLKAILLTWLRLEPEHPLGLLTMEATLG